MQSLRVGTQQEKLFIDTYNDLCYSHSGWEVWGDFCYMAAAAISNTVDEKQADNREKQYLSIIKRYSQKDQQLFPQMLAAVVEALEENPEQDFLGSMFMRLELGNHWHGQFFTPYHVCELMSEISAQGLKTQIEKDGWTGVSDPCCGAGAMLIAFAGTCMKEKINFQQHVIFAAQDIDMTAGLMCYIQLSLLGCPGYVVIRDSLRYPMTGDPLLMQPAEDTWITPMYCSDVWHWRRVAHMIGGLTEQNNTDPKNEIEIQQGADSGWKIINLTDLI